MLKTKQYNIQSCVLNQKRAQYLCSFIPIFNILQKKSTPFLKRALLTKNQNYEL